MHEILLIEDLESDALLIQRALQFAGVANPIRHALNGAEGLAYLTATSQKGALLSPPAVVLIDLKLPDISGFDILSFLQHQKAFADTLRIVLSQQNDLESVRKAYRLGAHSFLSKPACRQDIDELIKSFPKYWNVSLEQPRTPVSSQSALAQTSVGCRELFDRNRDAIEKLRTELSNLQQRLNNNDETFAVIDSIIDDFRKSTRGAEAQGKRR